MYTCEPKISLTFSFFEASVIVGGDGSQGQGRTWRFNAATPAAEVARLRTNYPTRHPGSCRRGQASVLGTRTYVRIRGRFCRALCYQRADFGEKAVEVLPKEGLYIVRGSSDAPTSPRAAQVGGG